MIWCVSSCSYDMMHLAWHLLEIDASMMHPFLSKVWILGVSLHHIAVFMCLPDNKHLYEVLVVYVM